MKKHQSWGRLIKSLHWLTALVVPVLFGLGIWMVELDYYNEWYRSAPHIHKSLGILLAILTLIRIISRLLRPRPPPLGGRIENRLANLVQMAMYALMLAIFCSGYLISTADGRAIEVFDWFEVPSLGEIFSQQEDIAGTVHEYLAFSLMGLVVLHILAALKHHFYDKDSTLKRMLIENQRIL